jgi:hypothetical protein
MMGYDTTEDSAATPIFLATSPQVEGLSGLYFTNCKETKCSFKVNKQAYSTLWDECDKLAQI